MQAQEFEPAKWGIALRMRDAVTEASIEEAFARGDLLRTHVLRPTWHFVARDDIRWLLALTAPRVMRIVLSYCRRSELDKRTLIRAAKVFESSLRDQQCRTRAELAQLLKRSRIIVAGIRLAFVTMYAELEGIICSGPRREKQFTYALVDERAPNARRLDRDDALAELCRRYFVSHGPATVRDFVWWSGLTVTDSKRGLDIVRGRREEVDGRTYWSVEGEPLTTRKSNRVQLLPIYDEYLVAYRDRVAVPHVPAAFSRQFRPGIFPHAIVVGGQVAGTWKPGPAAALDVQPVRPLIAAEAAALKRETVRYAMFRRPV